MTIVQPILIAITGAAAAFLLLISFFPTKNPLASRIEAMEQVAERNAFERDAKFERIFVGEDTGRLRSRLIEAGWYHMTPTKLAIRAASGIVFGIAIGLTLLLFMSNKPIAILCGALVAAIGWRMPKISLDRAIVQRKHAIERALPDFLDMLASTVKAGLALNAALIDTAEAVAGPLKTELLSTLAEIRLGRARADALKAMADRANESQLTTFVTGVVQAEALGSNLATMLRDLATDARAHRWALAEESAGKLPIKMLLPMGLLMMPSLYLMIFGPVIANVARLFGHR